jgi:alkanesulfonate monooxygenase SsuD/methylene tetrahydromethanopterin reductase-like flavin-dependent oxidoreductase (luciferase family)
VRIGVKPGQWGWSFDDLVASWAAAEDAGFDLVSCFDHVTAAPAGEAAWDAPTLLGAMAASTRGVAIGVHVINVSLRHPFLLAGQLAVAQAASGGRLEVGLGAGSYHLARHDHLATGIHFPRFEERMTALEACCRVFPALWRGAEVHDRTLGLEGASLGPVGIRPPLIVVGGSSDRAVEIAARHADGWNGSVRDADRFAELGSRLAEACRAEGRERSIDRQAQVFVRDIGLDRAREQARRFEEAGADTLVFVLTDERGPEDVRRLADAVI